MYTIYEQIKKKITECTFKNIFEILVNFRYFIIQIYTPLSICCKVGGPCGGQNCRAHYLGFTAPQINYILTAKFEL